MSKAICQHALNRVMLYLGNYGVEPSPEVCCKALRLIEECLQETMQTPCTDSTGLLSTGVIETVIDRLPREFELPALTTPLQRPPLRRGSIGYGPSH